jgi:glycosyltransferase involved in cell wall biosynthesis
MTLTIGICNHNYARYLPDCIASAERFADQVIIYDDASTDNSREVMLSSGHRCISAPTNSGSPVAGYNALIDAASCDWLMLLDADNQVFGVPPLAGDYTYGDILIIDAENIARGAWTYPGWPTDPATALERFRATRAMPVPAGGFWRVGMLRERGLRYRPWPSTPICADFATMLDWLRVGFDITYQPGYILAFRRHTAQQTGIERSAVESDVSDYIRGME